MPDSAEAGCQGRFPGSAGRRKRTSAEWRYDRTRMEDSVTAQAQNKSQDAVENQMTDRVGRDSGQRRVYYLVGRLIDVEIGQVLEAQEIPAVGPHRRKKWTSIRERPLRGRPNRLASGYDPFFTSQPQAYTRLRSS